MKISYGLTVCNEHEELQNLISFLRERIAPNDEIVVVYDQNRVTEQVLAVLDQNKSLVKSYPFDFQQNFLENKNFMNSKCSGDYIFQIDADEIPSEVLVEQLPSILESNPVELIITPRKNLVKGLTQEHVNAWGWVVGEDGRVNWPDWQKRVYKNSPEIQWTGHVVHGMVTGYKTYAFLPMEDAYCIIHNKSIDRQEAQNSRYDRIEKGELK